MIKPAEIAGIILSAGASKRMGSPKWKLKIGGISFLDRILNTFRQAGIRNIYVVFRKMNQYPEGDFIRSINPDPDRGQLSSLKTALDTIPSDVPFLMHLIDRPLISASTIQQLINGFDGEKIAIPAFEKRKGHPVLFPPGMRDIIRTADENSTIRSCIDSCAKGVRIVEAPDEKILWNIDTPEAFRKYENILNSMPDA